MDYWPLLHKLVCATWLSSTNRHMALSTCRIVFAYCLVVIIAWLSSIITQLLLHGYHLLSLNYCRLVISYHHIDMYRHIETVNCHMDIVV